MQNLRIIGDCSEEQRLLLAKELKLNNYTSCFTGDSVGDCFALEECDVGLTMTNYGAEYCIRVCDIGIDRDVMLIYHSMKFGRNIFSNIRKFVQYQMSVAINLSLYMFIGTMLFKDPPIQPSLILFMNYIMDTFASNTITYELPSNNEEILTQTSTFSSIRSGLFTTRMVFNIITTTVY